MKEKLANSLIEPPTNAVLHRQAGRCSPRMAGQQGILSLPLVVSVLLASPVREGEAHHLSQHGFEGPFSSQRVAVVTAKLREDKIMSLDFQRMRSVGTVAGRFVGRDKHRRPDVTPRVAWAVLFPSTAHG